MNLTITADEQTIRKARIRALNENTSVNAVVNAFLREYAQEADKQKDALKRFAAATDLVHSRTGDAARGWSREDAYVERVARHAG